MTWFTLDTKNYDHAIREIKKQRDRGAGLIATAILQDHLLEAIKSRLDEHQDIQSQMFKSSGPLGNFSTQIDVGLLLGLYDNGVREDLHIIRLVRNEFAHNVQPVSFRSCRDQCAKLDPPRGLSRQVNRDFHATLPAAKMVRLTHFQSSPA